MADSARAMASRNGGDPPVSGGASRLGPACPLYSCGVFPAGAEQGKRGWGGARNRAARASDTLKPATVANIMAAARFALALGQPLNRHVTIHWQHAGLTDREAARATGAYLCEVRRLLNRLGQPFCHVWVRENDGGDGSKGSHVHILMHVPPEVAPRVIAMQRRWIEGVTGKPYRRGTIRTRLIGGRLETATRAPAVYAANLERVLHYVLKAADHATATRLGLTRAPEHGRVIGKRAGWSENIGQRARSKIDWSE